MSARGKGFVFVCCGRWQGGEKQVPNTRRKSTLNDPPPNEESGIAKYKFERVEIQNSEM